MSDWQHVKSECFTLDKSKALDLASKHSGLQHSPVERSVDAGRVKKLVQIIRNGLALPFQWATVEYDGKTVRMNGQHSSAAIVEVGAELPDSLSFHLDHYKAKTRGGMIELFRQFDQRWSMRSSSDICGAFQGLVPDIAGCNRKIMKSAAEAISWARKVVDGEEGVPTGDDAYDILHQERHLPFLLWVNGIVNGRKELLKKEVMAAIYKTYDASQSNATEFWREVSFGPDYFSDDMKPGAVLIGELSKSFEDKEFRDREFAQSAIYYKKAVKAWNAHCAGQRIATLKVTKQKGWPDVALPGEATVEAA